MPYGKLSRRLTAALIAVLTAIGVAVCADPSLAASAADKQGQPVTPSGLYHHVWQLIKDHYYDPNYNGQNWTRWEHRYDAKLSDLSDARKAIDSMLASLGDRYTRYLDPTAFDDEKQQIEAKLYGIGIQMGLDKTAKLVVIAPIPNTPAERAGLMPMDEIIEINGKSTNGLSVEQSSKLIRGPIGTEVVLTIVRNKERKTVTVTRDEIPIKSVQTVKMLNGEIGYIRLSTFMSERASDEMREALEKLSPARGVIIDLRGNPGGLVTNAIDICSMFLDGGIIVSTLDRSGHMQSARAPGTPISHQAICLLINKGSASASEITSGALHDSQRAILVGEKSFGKGLVQSITRLEDGSGVNITIARYVTPNNIDIHKKGITPDYEVDLTNDDYKAGRGPWWLDPKGLSEPRSPEDGKDIQLSKAVDVLHEKMANVEPEFVLKLNPFPNSMPYTTGIGIPDQAAH